jgi:hypothetical protein
MFHVEHFLFCGRRFAYFFVVFAVVSAAVSEGFSSAVSMTSPGRTRLATTTNRQFHVIHAERVMDLLPCPEVRVTLMFHVEHFSFCGRRFA